MSDVVHMSWCVGEHNDPIMGGECQLTRTFVNSVDETCDVRLVGIPCDNLYIVPGDVWLYDRSDVDAALAVLTELGEILDHSVAEIDCDLHEHPEDDDPDEDLDDELD